MADLKIQKETALPALQANVMYLVGPPDDLTALEVYVSNNTGSAARRLPTKADINNAIDAKISGMGGGLAVLPDIAARDALTDPNSGTLVLVLDASDDGTVDSGAATYVYVSGTGWVKISEAESLDLALSWANLSGKPSSTVSDIDDAVSKRHAHSNKTQLDKVGEDGNGNLTYGGSRPLVEWASTGW